MIFPLIATAVKPNRLEAVKDKKYHTDMGRWALKGASSPALLYNIFKYIINWNFYEGNQWIFREDLEQFLMDETGDHRNRVRWCYNLIAPMVNHYVGNAIKTEFSVRAYISSPSIVEAQQNELATKLKAHSLADSMPLLSQHIKNKFNLGNTPQETEDQFLNDEDELEAATNALLKDVERFNRFDYLQRTQAQNLCLGGVGILKNREYNKKQGWFNIDPAYYFYDTSGVMPDHSDCEYQGDVEMFIPTVIYEQYPNLLPNERSRIEEASRNNIMYYNASIGYNTMLGTLNGRLPKYNVYWHDTDVQSWGYIRDALGNTILAKMDGEMGYTTKDLLPFEELTIDQQEDVGRKRIKKLNKDIIRFCEFIPSEFVGGEDIVCDYGIMPYQEIYQDAPFDSNTPYKVATYDYRFGKMLTPLDVVISPQRMMNRYLSMMESMLNKAKGDGLAYDKSIIPKGDGQEAIFQKNIRNGDPTMVDTARSGFSIPNTMMVTSDKNIEKGLVFQSLLNGFKQMTENTTGINQFMNGTNEGTKVLKSVQQNNIEQGSLQLEGFFNTIANQFYSVYKCVANKGRYIYANNEISLLSAVRTGRGAKLIKFTKAMSSEEMGITLRRVPYEQTNVDANNEKLISLLQNQLIDGDGFARLWNRSEMTDVSEEIRRYTKKKEQMGQVAAKDAQDAKLADQQHEKFLAGIKTQTADNRNRTDLIINTQNEQGKDNREARSGLVKMAIEREKKTPNGINPQ